MNTNLNQLLEAIIDLYLNVKIRNESDIEEFNDKVLMSEKENLKKLNPTLILEYIKSSIEILININVHKKIEEFKLKSSRANITEYTEDDVNIYEKSLRQLEAEIRNHIKIEHQLKLHSESLEEKIFELEKQKEEYKQKYKGTVEQLSKTKNGEVEKKNQEIEKLKVEMDNMKQIIKSYEDKNFKIAELEKIIRNNNGKYEKSVLNLEESYNKKISELNKQISCLESRNNANSLLTNKPSINEEKQNDKLEFKLNLKKQNLKEFIKEAPKASARTISCTDRIIKKSDLDHNQLREVSTNNEAKKFYLNKKVSTNSLITERLEHNLSSNNSLNKLASREKGNNKTYRRNNNSSVTKSLINNNSTENLTKSLAEKYTMSKSYIKNNSSLEKAQLITRNKSKNSVSKNSMNYNSQLKNSSSNLILSQNGANCFNNINIYTSSISKVKSNEFKLNQFIINKSVKPNNSVHKQNYSQYISSSLKNI